MSAVVTVRYWAAARAAAGCECEEYPTPTSLAALLEAVRHRHGHGSDLSRVLDRSSYLVDEVSPGRRPAGDVAVPDGATVEVLPPFAGGAR